MRVDDVADNIHRSPPGPAAATKLAQLRKAVRKDVDTRLAAMRDATAERASIRRRAPGSLITRIRTEIGA